jgi:uncharacterized protein YlxP (DUF503 family)
MVVGVLRLDLLVHGSQGLKDKRAVVKSILGRCRARFPVSCAETDHQNLWQRAGLGFAILENSEDSAHQVLQKVIEEVERIGLAEIVGQDIELIHYG